VQKFDLTTEQKNAIDGVLETIKVKQIITIGGFAGTGKSTCLSELADEFPKYGIACFTGKAANVLQKKGLSEAQTIHSMIYNVKQDAKGNPRFTIKGKYELPYDGFILDEASMIGEDLFKDLMYFEIPIICFGDHGQLEPIGSKFNLMEKPDFALETIHRNANNIARFAEYIRNGGKPLNYNNFDEQVQVISKSTVTNEILSEYDQVICGFNKTRMALNNRIRNFHKMSGIIAKDEKIICLKNNRNLKVFNGMQGVVSKKIKENKIGFLTNNKTLFLEVDTKQFGKEKLVDYAHDNPELAYFDYAYAITAHKAQGDEFDSVCVFEEQAPKLWNPARWSYTAATRAKQKLLWCL
jgi:exodeoxyribonuclease-5